ncbi:hypothetical protein KUV95_01025 [Microbulbifer agarilyticus]|uniref:hypothetical protein n=1 Tax=Microbulbifer agarilyticus TaxID=260552 RepID=UPI001C95892D|nr:hypothetical protein [Microbulbifer agarilyticus]MBY6210125.1 hypothetical protein [Microbulbifer agarilyticus]
MRLFTATCLFFCSVWANAAGSFYANPELQRQMPAAFALQPEAQAFLAPAFQQTIAHGDALVAAIQQDAELAQAIADWPKLTIEQQAPYLKRVFAIETQVMGIEPPTLLIDNHSYPGRMVYFDFDPQNPSTGTVYLNPDKLAERPKYDSLAFLIHETRHSLQFQHAFSTNADEVDALAIGYAEAFNAQKALQGFSFSDFLTLVNEYEAFQFGNYVLGKLTNWQLDTQDMGTYASQFDTHGKLKIDLVKLATEDAETSLLERYNVRAQKHFDLRERKANTEVAENNTAD